MKDVAKSRKVREQIIDAGGKIYLNGDHNYEENFNIKMNEKNLKGKYANLEEIGDVQQDIYTATFLSSVYFDCIQSFDNILVSKKESQFGNAFHFEGAGCIDSYDTIACDTDVKVVDGELVMDLEGYDRETKNGLFTAKIRISPYFRDIENQEDFILTHDDIWPEHVGIMALNGRNPEDVIKELPLLCDKRSVTVDGDSLRIPMSEETGQIMKEKGMIYDLECISAEQKRKEAIKEHREQKKEKTGLSNPVISASIGGAVKSPYVPDAGIRVLEYDTTLPLDKILRDKQSDIAIATGDIIGEEETGKETFVVGKTVVIGDKAYLPMLYSGFTSENEGQIDDTIRYMIEHTLNDSKLPDGSFVGRKGWSLDDVIYRPTESQVQNAKERYTPSIGTWVGKNVDKPITLDTSLMREVENDISKQNEGNNGLG